MYDQTDSHRHDTAGGTVSLAADLPAVPERLLLAHARGDVLFLCGAGASRPAGLPDFRQLVLAVYRTLDPAVYEILTNASIDPRCSAIPDCSLLTDRQTAEVKRFIAREYDVVLGMLERRLDSRTREDSKVRAGVIELLRSSRSKPGPATSRSEGMAAGSYDTDAPHPTGLSPGHTPVLPELPLTCHPSIRSNLLPIYPVCTLTASPRPLHRASPRASCSSPAGTRG